MQRPVQPAGQSLRRGHACGVTALLFGAAIVGTPICRAAGPEAPAAGITLSVTQVAVHPLSDATARRALDRFAPSLASTSQTMLWGTVAGMSAGVGGEMQRAVGPSALPSFDGPGRLPARSNAAVLVGVALSAGDRSRLELSAPLRRTDDDPSVLQRDRALRLGLSFKSRDPYADLRKGALMRMEISGPTVFSLRPRRGHLAMVVTSNW